MIGEINDPAQPLVTVNQPPVKKAKVLSQVTGPCHFGHIHTSARDLNGKPCWFQVPSGLTWNGAKPGDTLCNACIVKMRRRDFECEPCDDDSYMHDEEDMLISLPGSSLGPCSSTYFLTNDATTVNEIHAPLSGQSSGINDCNTTLVTPPCAGLPSCSTGTPEVSGDMNVTNEFVVPDCEFAFESNFPSVTKKDCSIVLTEPCVFDVSGPDNGQCFIFDDPSRDNPADVDLIKSASRDCADTFINQHQTNTADSVIAQIGSSGLELVSSVCKSVCDVISNPVLVKCDSQLDSTSAHVGPRGLALFAENQVGTASTFEGQSNPPDPRLLSSGDDYLKGTGNTADSVVDKGNADMLSTQLREHIACKKATAIAKRSAKERTAINKAACVAKRLVRARKPTWNITKATDTYFDVGESSSKRLKVNCSGSNSNSVGPSGLTHNSIDVCVPSPSMPILQSSVGHSSSAVCVPSLSMPSEAFTAEPLEHELTSPVSESKERNSAEGIGKLLATDGQDEQSDVKCITVGLRGTSPRNIESS